MSDPELEPEPWRHTVRDLAIAYKTPISLLVAAGAIIAGLVLAGEFNIPSWVPTLAWYSVVGSIAGIPIAWGLVWYLTDDPGIELLDLHPVASDHQHLRIGRESFADLYIEDPLGNEVGSEQLNDITVNGRQGYEVINYDPDRHAVTTSWMGGASADEMRAYRSQVEYIQRKLSLMADQYVDLRANLSPVVRDAASQTAQHIIQTSEGDRTPGNDYIADAVQSAMTRQGLDEVPETEDLMDAMEMKNPAEEARQATHTGGETDE
jgi:hypothetical protein